MSDPSPKLAPRPARSIPVARSALPGVVLAPPGDEGAVEPARSPWELQGWAWSILAHAILLLILGLWYFGGKSKEDRTFDTRLAGSDLGLDEGLTNLGGLDVPVTLSEPIPTTTTSEATFARLKPPEAPNPLGGLRNNPGAGQGDGFGVARFGNGGEKVRGVTVKVGDPQFTLLWDSPVDLDLHVIEPGGKEIFWNDPKGKFGGELDVDNVSGYGPENIYWLKKNDDGSKTLGPGPPGEYRWFVHYYGGNHGAPVPTRWKVRVKHDGQAEIFQGRLEVPNARSKNYSLNVGGPSIVPPEMNALGR